MVYLKDVKGLVIEHYWNLIVKSITMIIYSIDFREECSTSKQNSK